MPTWPFMVFYIPAMVLHGRVVYLTLAVEGLVYFWPAMVFLISAVELFSNIYRGESPKLHSDFCLLFSSDTDRRTIR